MAELFHDHALEPVARAYERCAAQLEASLAEENEAPLTLAQAAAESGYSADHLGRMVREGMIPNAGRPGAPRIARRDLPLKAGAARPPVAHGASRRETDRTQIVRSAIKEGAG